MGTLAQTTRRPRAAMPTWHNRVPANPETIPTIYPLNYELGCLPWANRAANGILLLNLLYLLVIITFNLSSQLGAGIQPVAAQMRSF